MENALMMEDVNWVEAEIAQSVALLEKGIASGESRFSSRALRASASIRHKLSAKVLRSAIKTFFPKDNVLAPKLIDCVTSSANAMDVDEAPSGGEEKDVTSITPEIEIYFGYLVLVYMYDKKENENGIALSTTLVKVIQEYNRRSLDQLASKVYFYFSCFHEAAGRLADVRPALIAAQRTAVLRQDVETQATLLNLLLRNFLHFNLYDLADKLASKATFPETAGNNQSARYMYYLGRIKAIQLDYTASHRYLQQAIRKAPQNPKSAGFVQAVNKLSIIVQLLTGEIPERGVFRQAFLRKSLIPYLGITQAVRVGDLAKFQDTLSKYASTFREDKTYTLILRLHHNVIKTGIRMISLSYSKISLRDICVKLQLDSEEDAEYIVAKAIRDGVIDATIDHEHGFMKSKENADIYSTNEPQNAFHQRISFCLNLHNESVKAMRFLQDSHRKDLALIDAIRDEERALSADIADGGDFDDGDDEEF